MHFDEVVVYTDGGARGNPGPAASGVVIMTPDEQIIDAFGVYLGETTNNQAEYRAIKFGLEKARSLGATKIRFYMDSELAMRQLTGRYRVKNQDLLPIFQEIKMMAAALDVTYEHIPRAKNKLADEQVNIAIDRALGLQK